jgi:hypothetical protein
MRRSSLGLAVALLVLGRLAAADAALAGAEQRLIEGMIAAVEQLKDARFVRNDEEYSARDAARFLRKKWKSREDEVRSAEDFIAKVGTLSSTTGKPYRIRFAGGREQPSAEFLRARLAELRSAR